MNSKRILPIIAILLVGVLDASPLTRSTNDLVENKPSGSYYADNGSKAFFWATTEQYGQELWVTDGTPNGTVMIEDRNLGKASFSSNHQLKVGDRLIFWDTAKGEWYVTDGSTPQLLTDSDGGSLTNYAFGRSATVKQHIGNKFIFNYTTTSKGNELWITDGTSAGTHILKDVNVGTTGAVTSYSKSIPSPDGTKIYVWLDDGVNGHELWITDATSAGTLIVKDISISNYPYITFNGFVNDQLIFSYAYSTTREMYRVNSKATDIIKIASTSSTETWGFDNGSVGYFIGNTTLNGNEYWVTDGTASGTKMIEDFELGSANGTGSYHRKISENLIFWDAGTANWYTSNGNNNF